jgi:hypothetical protein
MFARIDSSTFMYYLSMNSKIYTIEAGLQMIDFADDDVNVVSTYMDDDIDGIDGGGGDMGADGGGGGGGCGGCG